MARIKLTLPDAFSFVAKIPIRITDLNYGGHVGNDTILSLVHEARMQYLQSLGYTELNMENVGLIMADAAIEFKVELFYGDEVTVYVATKDISRAGFDFYYKLVKSDNGQIVALAKTGMVCFDYEKKKVVSVPEAAAVKLKN